MIDNAALQTILATADDFTVVVEVYSENAAPPFDPSTAEKRFAPIGGFSFAGEEYEQKIVRFNRAKRTIGKEVNTCTIELDNTDGTLAAWELATGFEGKIVLVRLVSRSQSTIENSLIVFVGRSERPDTANRMSVTLTVSQVIGAIDTELPRRKFAYDDPEGRIPTDKLFEGFRYTPQYGTVTYSRRKRLWWWSWLVTRNVKKYQQYSSFSDIDSNKYVPVIFGRAQVMGIHLSYADVGRFLHTVTAFADGPVLDIVNIRTDDPRFQFYDNSSGAAGYPALNKYQKRYGYAGGTGPAGRQQLTFSLGNFEGDGYYSRTAFIFGLLSGTDTLEVDPAPGVIAVVLGRLVTTPNSSGGWTVTDTFSDNPAAQAYFLLTSDEYGKLDSDWIDEDSFTEAYRYNDAVIYDSSFTDTVQVPNTSNFSGGDSYLGQYFASTGLISSKYLGYLGGSVSASSAYRRAVLPLTYESGGLTSDLGDLPNTLPGPRISSRQYVLRRRYTSNVVVTDSVKTADFLHDVIFAGSRMFLAQNADGKLALRHKKPAPFALATAAVSSTAVDVVDASPYVGAVPCSAVIDPHTASSEVCTVTAAGYSSASPTLTVGACLTAGSWTGSGGATPKTRTITVGDVTSILGGTTSVTLDGITIDLGVYAGDTSDIVAGWLALSIGGHPTLGRKFKCDWTPGTSVVTVNLIAGSLTLASAPTLSHGAPLADPTVAPTVSATGSGTALAAGNYQVAYSYINARGETAISPTATATITAGQKIHIGAITLPSGATGVRVYCSVQVYGTMLRMVSETDGSAFDITATPKLTTKVPPSANTTGCEIMRVAAVFSDRSEDRSGVSRSNVLKGSFKWRLGNRAQAKNFVEIQFRDSSQDYRLTTLNLKDDAHIAKVKKTNKLTVNGAAIDNYNQAYRIASGALAENLDADFFYSWTADREALLLQEGDIVAITDAGSGVVNLPVRIEEIEVSMDKSFPTVSFTARKYATSLYDDSVAERQIPVVLEAGFADSFA